MNFRIPEAAREKRAAEMASEEREILSPEIIFQPSHIGYKKKVKITIHNEVEIID